MSLASKLLSASGGTTKLYADDVFSAYTYTGNGSTQTITNGIDLAGKGGLVWTKDRTSVYSNNLMDTVRGRSKAIFSDSTIAELTSPSAGDDLTSFNSNGFSVGANYYCSINLNNNAYASWTFRKAPKFFDVVTYTGTGSNRTIAHSLGSVPGMIYVKRTNAAGSWMVYHNSIANTENLVLNTTAAKVTNATAWNSTTATSSVFSIGTHADVNTSAATYVAYLFAHDTSTDGLIQCGSYTGNGSATGPVITLGWEPQFLLTKAATIETSQSWLLTDSARGFAVSSDNDPQLFANLSSAEGGANRFSPTATGFNVVSINSEVNTLNAVYIYLAIRRPNKPPTTGTQVYNAIARTGTGAAATVTGVGFAPDHTIIQQRAGTAPRWGDRLRGAATVLRSTLTNAELTAEADLTSFDMDGVSLTGTGASLSNASASTYINHFFKRAPGVFDEVCDTGTGASHTISHNLGAVPDMMIRKGRSGATQWEIYCSSLANTEKLILNSTAAKATDTTSWNSTTPSSTTFTVGTGANVNTSAATYVTYLFATLAGISKVGSYTGNGSSQTIACGFTTGARFILIKRTDSTGDWYVWDTTRGIVAGNDPHLSLNTTAAEVTTDDSIDPDTSGFIVNQLTATNINVSSATYIFLSIA